MKEYRIKSKTHNIFFPLGAFSLASLLWIFVISGNQYTMVLDFPIEARNLNVQKAYLEEVPKFASVMVRGKGRDLFKAYVLQNYTGFKLVLDLEGISQEYEFILNQYFQKNPKKVVLTPSYDLSFVEIVYPNRIKIKLDEIMKKKIPIKSNMVISLSDGYIKIGTINFKPDSVEIVGPKAELAKIEYVYTLDDTMENVSNYISGELPILSLGKLIQISNEKVKYSLDIQQISERIIVDIPVEVKNIVTGLRVFPSPQSVSLTVIGGALQIAQINPEDIEVFVDFNKWSINKSFYEPEVLFPIEILEWRDLSPRSIELGVARESK